MRYRKFYDDNVTLTWTGRQRDRKTDRRIERYIHRQARWPAYLSYLFRW